MSVDLIQTIMDRAYRRWQENDWTMEQFHATLSADESVAVFVGNLNYQVENGGFSQWHGNGYATANVVKTLRALCTSIGGTASKAVGKLLRTFSLIEDDMEEGTWDEDLRRVLEKLDNDFYKVNTAFLAEVETYLAKRVARNAPLTLLDCQEGALSS